MSEKLFVKKTEIDVFDESIKAGDVCVLVRGNRTVCEGENIIIEQIPGNDRRMLMYIRIKKNQYYSWVGEAESNKLYASEVAKGEYTLYPLIPKTTE